ncbi:Glycosyltransferase, GT2 family [Flexibacter flexilis DSM 6793]|uniref:Glycosyltransferase, GT2 family n=1 Tax=Flexibacter flexilis DSM 6793 TaxID=927664 RepID=A0A1I1JZL9_9BACT|nr:glycosyltransferase family 2 protein [Flexibacter flexilis]SFC54129.1 Glycosyltransferase, GT2 family [Flexibacter flexilis DSM 6793]
MEFVAPRVSVVILNWNGRKHLQEFMPSVVAHSPEAAIVVADNASTDDSVAFLQSHYPQVHIIQNSTNGGFSKGYNDALAHIDTEYAVLLNSDVAVTQGWLAPLLALMDSNTQIAACQPKIRAYLAQESFEYAGAAGGFVDKYGYPFCRGRLFDTLETDNHQYDDTTPVFWATGACMFVRLEVYKKLGGLDEAFFAHMEEIDLCWRMQNAGYQVFACGGSVVFHLGGGTLPKNNPRKTFLNFRNGIVLLFKNLPTASLFPIIFTRLVLDGVAGAKMFFSGQTKDTWAIIKAHFAFYGGLPHWIKARRHARQFAKQEAKRTAYSIVFEYFVKNKKTYSDLMRS